MLTSALRPPKEGHCDPSRRLIGRVPHGVLRHLGLPCDFMDARQHVHWAKVGNPGRIACHIRRIIDTSPKTRHMHNPNEMRTHKRPQQTASTTLPLIAISLVLGLHLSGSGMTCQTAAFCRRDARLRRCSRVFSRYSAAGSAQGDPREAASRSRTAEDAKCGFAFTLPVSCKVAPYPECCGEIPGHRFRKPIRSNGLTQRKLARILADQGKKQKNQESPGGKNNV